MIEFILALIRIYTWIIIIRVLLSWIPMPENQAFRTIYGYLYDITEPYLGLFRRVLPSAGAGGVGIDLSPILAILVLFVLEGFLAGAL